MGKLVVVNRREFLIAAALPLYAAGPLQTFSGEEARLVEALCDQVIPADDSPGAKQAGVLYYIDRQLAGPLQRFEPAYHGGLSNLRRECQDRTGRDFADLPFLEQTKFLEGIEAGRAEKLISFWRLVIDHTMQGFYGSPANGGNRDAASWDMLGIRDVMGGHSH
ncbi:MAG TPA: gluconate 2-dehydrogenase subunit 3 family protein [Bryobacteraceae bacterium]|jgi:gluconate 2-dehydrogenase gamma chain|nr:gluconate 2-dehydrogenase subunit 3 family protein [Bryobacteraceae bacterium]